MLDIKIDEILKNATIIEGFPSLGLVSTIATEFLIEHLGAKSIGRIETDKLSPIAIIHESKVIEPLEVFYDKKHNLILLRALTEVSDIERELANIILELAKKVGAKEIINLEGIPEDDIEETKSFFYTNSEKHKKIFEKLGVPEFKEGKVGGVTGALILSQFKKTPITSLFAETNLMFPDSRAAAEVIKVLDSYLDLDVDYKPLIKNAEKLEEMIKGRVKEMQEHQNLIDQKRVSYLS
jgi:uncharacterized protein